MTEIDGVDIHFIHVKSRHENALPLIMTHGWPGSVMELLEITVRSPIRRRMADGAEDAFHAVCRRCRATASPASRPRSAGAPLRIAQAWAS